MKSETMSRIRFTWWNINVDVDRFINPYLLPSPARRLPPLFSRFLGYRHEQPRQLGNVIVAVWSFIGTLASLSLIYAVNGQLPAFIQNQQAPLILGSFGAAAVLEYCAIDFPLAQPRNVFLGQLMGSIIGVAISKGVTHNATFQSEGRRCLAGALSCGLTIVATGLTKTVHPPAGATALLAVTDDSVRQLGWMLVPIVLLDCTLMLVVSLFLNNLQRRFPLYWWTPDEVGSFWTRGHSDSGDSGDSELAKVEAGAEVQQSAFAEEDMGYRGDPGDQSLITVTSSGIFTGSGVRLRPEEKLYLEDLLRRL
ncbi:hypothetical protein N0V93_002065 [Gnomoniopsis smithogilvyi]|uniref:HPP transmembrane region domain-containing protein n=1 Tax=Gnomoniopsis smithogilvyi TaxID=1191159 RepID=A0A9W8Z4Z2_9PEZI|nr:hypothetical protein N0V93_002065 [Gnomoniopsis smithogilvyi]